MAHEEEDRRIQDDLRAQLQAYEATTPGVWSLDDQPLVEMCEKAHLTTSELRESLRYDLIKSLAVAVRQSRPRVQVVAHSSHPLVAAATQEERGQGQDEEEFQLPPRALAVIPKRFDDEVALRYREDLPPCINWKAGTCACRRLGSPFPLNSLNFQPGDGSGEGYRDDRCLLCVRRDFAEQWWGNFVRGEHGVLVSQPFRSLVGRGEYALHATFERGMATSTAADGGGHERYAGVSDHFVQHALCRLVLNVAGRRVDQIGVDWESPELNTYAENGCYVGLPVPGTYFDYDKQWSAELDAMRLMPSPSFGAGVIAGEMRRRGMMPQFEETLSRSPDPLVAERALARLIEGDADERAARSALVRAVPRAFALQRPAPRRSLAALLREVVLFWRPPAVLFEVHSRFMARALTLMLSGASLESWILVAETVSARGSLACMRQLLTVIPQLAQLAVLQLVERYQRDAPMDEPYPQWSSRLSAALMAGGWPAAERMAAQMLPAARLMCTPSGAASKKKAKLDRSEGLLLARRDVRLIRMPPHWRSESDESHKSQTLGLDREILVCPQCVRVKCHVVRDPRPKWLQVKRKEKLIPWWLGFSRWCFWSCVRNEGAAFDYVRAVFTCYRKPTSSSRKMRDEQSVKLRVAKRLVTPALALPGGTEPRDEEPVEVEGNVGCQQPCVLVRMHGFLLEMEGALLALCWRCSALCELDDGNPLSARAEGVLCGSCDAWQVAEARKRLNIPCSRCGASAKRDTAEYLDVFRYGPGRDEFRRLYFCPKCYGSSVRRVPGVGVGGQHQQQQQRLWNWLLLKEII